MSVNVQAISSQRLYAAAASTSSYPITIASWVYPTNASNEVCMQYGNSSNSSTVMMQLSGSPNYHIACNQYKSGSSGWVGAWTSTSYSVNQWNHMLAMYVGNYERYAYLNGDIAGKAYDTQYKAVDTYNYVNLACWRQPASSGTVNMLFTGYIAEVAIWQAQLSEAEIVSLAKGFSPLLIRPASLIFYAPLTRNNGSGGWIELVDGRQLIEVNSPVVAEQPRIIQPAQSLIVPSSYDGNITVLSQYYRKMRVA